MSEQFFIKVGDEYHPVHSIGSVDLEEVEKPHNDKYVLSDLSELEFHCEIECDTDIAKAVLPRSMYNAYALKRDGYLNPKNASFMPDEDDYRFRKRL